MPTIIVDLDGTLADCDWRLHHIKNKPKNWKAFFDGIVQDEVIEPIYSILWHMTQCGGVIPIFCTGRPENYRKASLEWIERAAGIPNDFSHLYMRPQNDHRPDYEVKKDLLKLMRIDGLNPTLAIDDKPEVCDMYEAEGLVVLQVRRKNG
jgi:hypothetical protein